MNLDTKVNVIHNVNMIHTLNPSTRRERHRAEKSQAILDCAFKLTQEQGLDGLTMPRLAAELDCAVGALYRYYPSKQALIAAMQVHVLGLFTHQQQQQQQNCQEWAHQKKISPLVNSLLQILARAESYQDLQVAYPLEFHLLALTIGTPQQLVGDTEERAVLLAAAPMLTETIKLLQAATQSGALNEGSPIERAWIMWLGMQGLLQSQKLLRFGILMASSRQLVLNLITSLMAGWGATSSDITAAVAALKNWKQEQLS